MPPEACPGCGLEYARRDVLCPCGYAERAVRWAERETAPPEDWLARKRADRAVREQFERLRALEQERIQTERRKLDQLIEEEFERARAARAAAKPPPPKPKPRKPKKPKRPPAERLRLEARRLPDPREVRQSWERIALTRQLSAESRFCEQRTEAAHRNFLKILERVAPGEETAGWREPLEPAQSGPRCDRGVSENGKDKKE